MIIKVTYWGMAASGKTTIVDTLHKLTTEQKKDIKPKGQLIKIAKESGATLYFDRGTWESTTQENVVYNINTVAGQKAFSPLRKRVFEGTNGVIFVADSQINLFQDNIESLKELKVVAKGKLITEIPLIIMLNKQDLDDVIGPGDLERILKEEKLWYEPGHELNMWNPMIYKTCALYNLKKDIYRSFSECARRTRLYMMYGNGKAPPPDIQADIGL